MTERFSRIPDLTSLLADHSTIVERLERVKTELAEHILSKHGGVPASTCHRCLTKGQTIRENNMLLAEVNHDIALAEKQS